MIFYFAFCAGHNLTKTSNQPSYVALSCNFGDEDSSSKLIGGLLIMPSLRRFSNSRFSKRFRQWFCILSFCGPVDEKKYVYRAWQKRAILSEHIETQKTKVSSTYPWAVYLGDLRLNRAVRHLSLHLVLRLTLFGGVAGDEDDRSCGRLSNRQAQPYLNQAVSPVVSHNHYCLKIIKLILELRNSNKPITNCM